MTFKSIDFDADEAAQYLAVGETMAAIYCDDEILFGPIEAPNWPEDFSQLSQEDQVTVKKEINIQKDLIVKGKSRIKEKTKEIRQSFPKVVVSRSGSGKLAFEHYKNLISIWPDSANIKPLSFRISTGELDDEHEELSADLDVQEDNNNEHVDNNQDESDSEPNVDAGNSLQTSMPPNSGKRKSGGSIVPRLIDNKRKHLERNLLAAQRDQLLMKEMKMMPSLEKICFRLCENQMIVFQTQLKKYLSQCKI